MIDVDGCLTDGSIFLDEDGRKLHKLFGPDDHDAINAARELGVGISLVTADKLGYDISRQRALQLHVPIALYTTQERAWHASDRIVYIGDGYQDELVFVNAGFGIAPSDAYPTTKRAADAVCSRPGGRRAVAQAIDFTLRWLR